MEDADDEEAPCIIDAVDYIVRRDELAQIAGPNSVDRLAFDETGCEILAGFADLVGISTCLSGAEQAKALAEDVPDIGFGLS